MKLTQLATIDCGGCSCGCPTIFEDSESGDFVIIGMSNAEISNTPTVSAKTGAGEAAVRVPRTLIDRLIAQKVAA